MITSPSPHLSTTASTFSSAPFTYCQCVRWCVWIYGLKMDPTGTEYIELPIAGFFV